MRHFIVVFVSLFVVLGGAVAAANPAPVVSPDLPSAVCDRGKRVGNPHCQPTTTVPETTTTTVPETTTTVPETTTTTVPETTTTTVPEVTTTTVPETTTTTVPEVTTTVPEVTTTTEAPPVTVTSPTVPPTTEPESEVTGPGFPETTTTIDTIPEPEPTTTSEAPPVTPTTISDAAREFVEGFRDAPAQTQQRVAELATTGAALTNILLWTAILSVALGVVLLLGPRGRR